MIPIEGKESFVKRLYPIIVSKLCATYFKKANVNLSRNAFPKINVGTLETFPIPNLSEELSLNLEKFADLMLQNHKELNQISTEFISFLKAKFEFEKVSQKMAK